MPRDTLDAVERFEAGLGSAVRGAIPPASLEAIERVPAMGWLSVEHDRHVSASVVSVMGQERAGDFFRFLIAQLLDGPLLRATWTATVRLFGLSPASLMRAVPIAWPALFQNFATPKLGPSGPGVVGIELVDVHPMVVSEPSYCIAFRSLFAGLADACNGRGECDGHIDEARRVMAFELHWSATSAAESSV